MAMVLRRSLSIPVEEFCPSLLGLFGSSGQVRNGSGCRRGSDEDVGSEHHAMYQYNLVNAANHYMGLIQTETVCSVY